MQTFYFLPIFPIKLGSAMSPKKEARLLTTKDVVVTNGQGHKVKAVQDFGNRIIVNFEDGTEARHNVDDDVEVE